ncbi:MAG: histidine kinase dimerization/phospho-acceptor domain-containing protein, partial [Rhizobiaceae bacterium]
ASHELRTPLNGIRAEADVALDAPDATERERLLGQAVRTAVDRSERLVDGLLALARSESTLRDNTRLDLAELVGNVVGELSRTADIAGITLDLTLEAAPVMGDRMLLERLVANIVENAIRHNQRGGWVRDLLTGAYREEAAVAVAEQPAPKTAQPNRSPLQVVESLNSLSVDIARAIDHEASIELWNRYRRGERDVFTRRLYTLKGQQTFDDIRVKYQTDGEFRAAVDRYCDDFEKLLKDVSRNDRDNMMTQTYLTSDTGKVYTMLAHASGRLR